MDLTPNPAEEKLLVPPHSAEAERAVLGAALKSPNAFGSVMERLREEDFYLPANRCIYAAMLDLHSAASPVDVVTVVSYLESRNRLKEAGGVSYVTDLPRETPTVTNLPHYLAAVEEQSVRRRLIAAADEIAAQCYDGSVQLSLLLSGAEKRVFDISMKNMSAGLRPIAEDLAEVYMNLANVTAKDGITGTPTGFPDLDNMLAGLQPSDLVIVAGRPSMGKTSFAMNMATNAALRGATIAVFSLEMSREQLIARMLCSEARVDMQAMRVGDLSGDDWSSLADAMTALTPTQFYIDDTAGITVAEMRTKLRRLKLETGKLDMVVIDYLQLMNYTGRAENRTQIVAEITRALKMLARELAVPIVLLSQLSRAPEQRPISERRPRMSDLRESGAIEQDADVIIMLYRPAVYDPEAGNEAYAIIAKHRNGPTGDIQLVWDGAHASFMSVAYREE